MLAYSVQRLAYIGNIILYDCNPKSKQNGQVGVR